MKLSMPPLPPATASPSHTVGSSLNNNPPIIPATYGLRKKDTFDLDHVKRRMRVPKLDSDAKIMRNKQSRRSVFQVFFFPYYLSWWKRRMPSFRPYLIPLSILYMLQVSVIVHEFLWSGNGVGVVGRRVEVLLPLLLLSIYAMLMGRVSYAASNRKQSSHSHHSSNSHNKAKPEECSTPPLTPLFRNNSDNSLQTDVSKTKSSKSKERSPDSSSSSEDDDDDNNTSSSSSEDNSNTHPKKRRSNNMKTDRPAKQPEVRKPTKVRVRRSSLSVEIPSPVSCTLPNNNFTATEPTVPLGLESEEDEHEFPVEKKQHIRELPHHFTSSYEDLDEAVKSVHWTLTGTPEKMVLTTAQIRSELEEKCMTNGGELPLYRSVARFGAIALACTPIVFRLYDRVKSSSSCQVDAHTNNNNDGEDVMDFLLTAGNWSSLFTDMGGIISVISSLSTGVLLNQFLLRFAGAVETFERRYLYAKYFSWLTSNRKAQRAGLPYFRLHKVDAIKVWLSLRSRRMDLDKERIGPYLCTDVVTHFLFMVSIVVGGVVAFRAMSESSPIGSRLQDWFVLLWGALLSLFVQRITVLSNKTQERYSSTSILLTEEMNIHMRLLRKPEKKDELQACNSMLKVAGSLIKELEGSKGGKKGGGGEAFVLDPTVYSIVRVVFLSALGALSSDLLGFRVRIWKI